MATNLAKHFPGLLIWNRDPSKCAPLLSQPELKCKQASSLKEVAEQANIIFIMLANDTAVTAVVKELIGFKPSDQGLSVIVDCSTVLPSCTEELSNAAKASGIEYIACPVLGR
jgi:3-hydroxyisobutyrate dehydrogenase